MTGASGWRIDAHRVLALEPWCLMGILNVTPDSFSDGGVHLDPEHAVESGVEMTRRGASVLDIGGESTRPGADAVSIDEQIRRVVPVIKGLRRHPEGAQVIITIDTTRAAVAEAAFDAGADAVNDVSAGTDDPAMFPLIGKRDRGVILMHRLRRPELDSFSDRYEEEPVYKDVVDEVREWLAGRVSEAMHAGIHPDAIAVDPGLGFGKSVEQNHRLLVGLPELISDGRPVLVGASRKSFLGAVTGISEPRDRDPESIVAAVDAWQRGARFFRVHNPDLHHRALLVAAALATPTGS
ncbi:MAG: dihydropteroate synthase [Planctomycetota bacterium]|nr:dihydropteroate synthase [Planctomycetota bacterium]